MIAEYSVQNYRIRFQGKTFMETQQCTIRDRFLKITLGTPSVSAKGAMIEVWGVGRGSAPHQKNFSILDLKWANFGANSAFCTVHLKLVSLV